MIKRYTTEDFAKLWSDKNKYNTWLQIELIACEYMEPDIVPAGTANRIKSKNITIDLKEIEDIEKITKHDVIAFLTHIERLVGEDAKWLHYGMTSSDLLDTSLAYILTIACKKLAGHMNDLICALSKQVKTHENTVMIGRSHGRHAELLTFGLVLAGHLEETRRNLSRLNFAADEIKYGKLSGAVGTCAHIEPVIENIIMYKLGLWPEIISTQVIPRDRHAFLFSVLALIATGIERLATNIRSWQRDEIAEVFEGFSPGQKGSSAMPHKRNPILSENLCGLARMMRSYVMPAYENIPLWHERDISHSSVERIIAPDATSLLAFMLERTTELVNNLVVKPEKMRENIGKSNTHFSEAILLTLIRNGFARQKAYELVQKASEPGMVSVKKIISLIGAGVTDELIKQLNECQDETKCLKHINEIISRTIDE